ncbi:YqzG/YhdC family protein [Virgibacillus natechei]
MRKLFLALSMTLLLTSISTAPIHNQYTVSAQDETPPYAKWGRLAMKETKSEYPDADIIDYLHVGSHTSDDETTQKFKLWLKEEAKEYGVFIDITFHNETEELVQITFEETLE